MGSTVCTPARACHGPIAVVASLRRELLRVGNRRRRAGRPMLRCGIRARRAIAMRLSRYFLPVTKETPADAQIVSHKLMLRAGLIRQTAAGIYAWLPLGHRVLEEDRADRPRGAGPGRRGRIADADHPVGRPVAPVGPLRRLRPGDAALPGPARARDALRADQRGDDHPDLPRRRSNPIATCRARSTISSGSSATRSARASASCAAASS